MRRMNKELKRVNRDLEQLEGCIYTQLCKLEGVVPENGNGCRYKVSCERRDYFAVNLGLVALLQDKKSYLTEKRDRLYACS